MSEMLLGQNISLIYKFIEDAVKKTAEGDYWEGLRMLRTAGALVYKSENCGALEDLKKIMETIEEHSKKINFSSPELTFSKRSSYANTEASKVFTVRLEALRDYMQTAGYYLMMNKSWDRKIVEMSTVKPIEIPPNKKTYSTELTSDVIKPRDN